MSRNAVAGRLKTTNLLGVNWRFVPDSDAKVPNSARREKQQADELLQLELGQKYLDEDFFVADDEEEPTEDLADREATDAEVARVLEASPRAGDSKKKGEEEQDSDGHRSPTPVILWKPAARVVSEADIPLPLRQFGLDVHTTENAETVEVHAPATEGATKARIETPSVKTKPRSPANPKSSKPRKPKLKYGAWYLKPSTWKPQYDDGKNSDSEDERQCAEDWKGDDSNVQMERKHASIKAKIPTLYISKVFKSWLEKEYEGRVPHYLADVEVDEFRADTEHANSPNVRPKQSASRPAHGGQ